MADKKDNRKGKMVAAPKKAKPKPKPKPRYYNPSRAVVIRDQERDGSPARISRPVIQPSAPKKGYMEALRAAQRMGESDDESSDESEEVYGSRSESEDSGARDTDMMSSGLHASQLHVGSTSQVHVGSTSQVHVGSTSQVHVGSTSQVHVGSTSQVHVGSTSQVQGSVEPETRGVSVDDSAATSKVSRSHALPSKGAPNPGTDLPIAYIHSGKLSCKNREGQNAIASFWTPNFRRKMRKFYPRWYKVPDEIKDALWEELKLEVDMSMVREALAKRLWMKANSKNYRNFLSTLKKSALKQFKASHPKELIGKPPMKDCPNRRMWRRMVKHWCSPEHLKKSDQGRNARLSTDGRDGKISKSGYGRVGPGDRQLREADDTGVLPPIHKIMSDANQKKDQTGKLTGEVIDPLTSLALQQALEKYRTMEEYDPNAEFIPDDVMGKVYLETEVIKEKGLKKQRVLGCGPMYRAFPLMKKFSPSGSEVDDSDPAILQELERLRAQNQQRELEAQERELQLRERELKLQEEAREKERSWQARFDAMSAYLIQLGSLSSLPPPPEVLAAISSSQPLSSDINQQQTQPPTTDQTQPATDQPPQPSDQLEQQPTSSPPDLHPS